MAAAGTHHRQQAELRAPARSALDVWIPWAVPHRGAHRGSVPRQDRCTASSREPEIADHRERHIERRSLRLAHDRQRQVRVTGGEASQQHVVRHWLERCSADVQQVIAEGPTAAWDQPPTRAAMGLIRLWLWLQGYRDAPAIGTYS